MWGFFYLRSVSCAQWCVVLVSGVRVVYLRSVSCPQWCVVLVSGVRVVYLLKFVVICVGLFLSSFCVLSSMVWYVSKWVRVVYLRSVSCPQWCVMLVNGSVLFIFLSLL